MDCRQCQARIPDHGVIDLVDLVDLDRIEDFEAAFRTAIASGKPTLIAARITRLALPNYSPDPEGVLAAIWKGIKARFGLAD